MSVAAIAGRLDDVHPEALSEGAALAGYIAHELRTPLATQRALLELVAADPGVDEATWREVAEELLEACKQQERILDACVVLARSQRGLCRRERVDIARIVGNRLRGRDSCGLTVRSALEMTWAIGDADLIERLVDNVVGNAIRHNRPAGWIEVGTRRTRSLATLTVENTGPPIRDVDVERLFEPFQQLAGESVSVAGGLGLGLSIAKAVVDAHDASITARARPSGGLRVEVAFPTANRRASMLSD